MKTELKKSILVIDETSLTEVDFNSKEVKDEIEEVKKEIAKVLAGQKIDWSKL